MNQIIASVYSTVQFTLVNSISILTTILDIQYRNVIPVYERSVKTFNSQHDVSNVGSFTLQQ